MHRARLSAVLSLSVLLSTLVAAQDASYTFTTIDVPGATFTFAFGINTAGQIVGRFGDATGSHQTWPRPPLPLCGGKPTVARPQMYDT
jgi:hypothetical protein